MKKIMLRGTALLFSLFTLLYLSFSGSPPASDPPWPQADVPGASQAAFLYYLRDFEGMLAVFAADNPEPLHIYEIFTDSLPPEDGRRLRFGIGARNEAELQRLIEDYTS